MAAVQLVWTYYKCGGGVTLWYCPSWTGRQAMQGRGCAFAFSNGLDAIVVCRPTRFVVCFMLLMNMGAHSSYLMAIEWFVFGAQPQCH